MDFTLTKPVTLIGRKETCDIRIPLAEVSRRHTEVHVDEVSVWVKDAGSANGTYVNNKRVVEKEKLAPGDHLIIGPVVFTVQVNGDPSDIRQVRTKLKSRRAQATPEKAAASAQASSAALDDSSDPISALEALASSADQTAIDPLDDDDLLA